MSELLKAYDPYTDLNPEYYFTSSYDCFPSTLSLHVPLERKKENMDKVVEFMNLPETEYELVFKYWNTKDEQEADPTKDFAFHLLYKSLKQKSLISIELEYETLNVDFYYDCQDSKLEKEILSQNDRLRKKFGPIKTPTFNVLTKCQSGFATQKVKTDKIEMNLAANYNDDFEEVYHRVGKSIPAKESGLILLYGKPGTGKTTYIRSLISTHDEANFIFIQNEFVTNLLDPDFISFLLRQRNSILVIEDAEKVIASRESSRQDSVVSTILQLTDGLFSDYLNIKVICTFNTDLSKIDTALLRKGRLIAMYEFNPLSLEKTNRLLDELGAKKTDVGMSVSDIYNFEEKSYRNVRKKNIGFTTMV